MRTLEWYNSKYGPEVGPSKLKEAQHRLFLRTRPSASLITCLECGSQLKRLQHTHFKKCGGSCSTLEEYKIKHPNSPLVSADCAKISTPTLEGMKLKYGDEIGEQKWMLYCRRQANSNSFEFKQNKHGWTFEEWQKFNKSRAVTKQLCIERHGPIQGLVIWEQYVAKQVTNGNSLEWFISKYGEIDGTEKYQHVNFLKSHCEETFKIRYGENWETEYTNWILRFRSNSSKMAEQFISDVIEMIGESDDLWYSPKTTEYFLRNQNQIFFYDLANLRSKKILEIHGDYWHANPKIYNEQFVNNQIGKTFQEIHDYDRIKTECAVTNGFDVMVVWEHEIKKDRFATLQIVSEWMSSNGI